MISKPQDTPSRGPFHRSSDTLAWLQQHTPDVAIIDIHLRDGPSVELARTLRGRGVPFIVFSGDKRDGRSPEAFDGARWLSKPVGARQLLETVSELLEACLPGSHAASEGETHALAV